MVYFTCFSNTFHGNLNRQFSKTYEPLVIEALKPCGDCAYILRTISKTSLAERFRAAIFKSPLKTLT